MTYFVAENSRALDILVNEHGVKLFTPPADYPPAFLKAANTVLKTYEEEDPFFKEVVASMREFADTAVPYRVETLKQSRSAEHTPELQSLMRISYAVFCLKNKIV